MTPFSSLVNLLLVFVISFLLTPVNMPAQSYNTTLGLRLGDGIGISARQRLLKRTSFEGLFYQHHKSDQAIAGLLIAQHMPVLTRRLNLYAGGGLGWTFPDKSETVKESYKAFMLNAGLEFTIGRLNMSWDFVPVIPVSEQEEGLTSMTAFSLRYVLVKKSKNGLFEKDKKNPKSKKRKNKNKQRKHRKHSGN